jgi:hypothetical protein
MKSFPRLSVAAVAEPLAAARSMGQGHTLAFLATSVSVLFPGAEMHLHGSRESPKSSRRAIEHSSSRQVLSMGTRSVSTQPACRPVLSIRLLQEYRCNPPCLLAIE